MSEAVASNKDAREVWRRIVPGLLQLRVLTKQDGVALEGLCISYARAIAADRAVKKYGVIITDAWGGLKANPAVTVSSRAWSEVRKFAGEFGLTPSSRTRVRAEDGGDGPSSGEAEDFFFGNTAKVAGHIGPA